MQVSPVRLVLDGPQRLVTELIQDFEARRVKSLIVSPWFCILPKCLCNLKTLQEPCPDPVPLWYCSGFHVEDSARPGSMVIIGSWLPQPPFTNPRAISSKHMEKWRKCLMKRMKRIWKNGDPVTQRCIFPLLCLAWQGPPPPVQRPGWKSLLTRFPVTSCHPIPTA